MKRGLFALVVVSLGSIVAVAEQGGRESLDPKIASYVGRAAGEFDQIPAERKKALEKVALYVQGRIAAGQEAKLTFICTHNSRRSQFAQVWAQTAACYYGVPSVETYSGGIEATACNPRTVAALGRAGFKIKKTSGGKDPVYEIAYSPSHKPMRAFSKIYSDAPNPTSDFCAVMTCDHADKNCPIVRGASLRVPILYVDPQKADGTPQEAATYDERCRQICREMAYLFSKVAPTKAAGK